MTTGVFQDGVFQPNVFHVGTDVTSTAILQLPVDYALAGEQGDPDGRRTRLSFRPGRAAGFALKHAFSEK